MSILITGGAGFIGSFTARRCTEAGYRVVVLDNLSTGAIEQARWGVFHRADIREVDVVRELLRAHQVQTVVHLAAHAHVGESIADPARYFSNNVSGTVALLEAMLAENVPRLVFASSCSVYGNAASLRIGEDGPAHPASPYGESKLIGERALEWYGRAYGLRSIALRYFNVAGADAYAGLGEDIETSLRIVPRALYAAVQDRPFTIFGTDFDTVDGTAVRDYVHVADIAEANLLAIRHLEQGGPGATMNLGTGAGCSVRQIVDQVGQTLGRPLQVIEQGRREGDVPYAVADADRAASVLGWRPVRSSLSAIVGSVIEHHRTLTES
ncbi:MAG TPA: UDP-glucose 4-epimerase GalE [Candidatus Sulfopaludibacter sp.]|jgi:UDP-glucose-4-epimerase GalE|nr:UDP-glucose 4-epimerase GalE [Candidatus Sulfopaludibacter sp.]